MTPNTLPAVNADAKDDLVVYQPPTAFEVVDRGSGEIINFPTMGDYFVGIYEGLEEVTNEEGEQLPMATFTGANAKSYCIFPNRSLKRGLGKVEPKQWCRITFIAEIDTGKPSPMKSFVVEVAK